MSSSQDLKSLQVSRHKLMRELEDIKDSVAGLQRSCDKKRKLIKSIELKIENLTTAGIVVSEHAIIRFLEKAMGLDIAQVQEKILGETSADVRLPDGKYPICEALRAVVKNGVIVTVV